MFKKSTLLIKFTVLCSFFSILHAQPVVAANLLHMESEVGDYIGQGSTYDYDDSFTYTQNPYGNAIEIRVDGWSLIFEAPGTQLEQSVYLDATRWPFQSPAAPGLSVTGQGRGCNESAGKFIVHEVVHGSNATVDSLAVDFIQYCDGSLAALTGSIRYNSAIPLIAIQPVAYAGPDKNVIEGDVITLDASSSYAGSVSIISYQWTQLSGPTVTFNDPAASNVNFTIPEVALGGEEIVIQLEITNANSDTSIDILTLNAASKSDPQTYLLFNSELGDYIGQGLTQYIDLNDGTFTSTYYSYDNTVQINISTDSWWTLDFAPPSGYDLIPGAYEAATRWPFQLSSEPGLDISGDGRGCNTLTGRFDVLANARNDLNEVVSFAADFEQHCEGAAAALFGEIRYNYLPPYIPRANAGNDQQVLESDLVSLSANASVDSDGTIQNYTWTQIEGTPVQLSNTDTVQVSFTAPQITNDVSEVLTFKLLVKDNDNYKNADTVTVTVSASSDNNNSPGSNGGGAVHPAWILVMLGILFFRREKME